MQQKPDTGPVTFVYVCHPIPHPEGGFGTRPYIFKYCYVAPLSDGTWPPIYSNIVTLSPELTEPGRPSSENAGRTPAPENAGRTPAQYHGGQKRSSKNGNRPETHTKSSIKHTTSCSGDAMVTQQIPPKVPPGIPWSPNGPIRAEGVIRTHF